MILEDSLSQYKNNVSLECAKCLLCWTYFYFKYSYSYYITSVHGSGNLCQQLPLQASSAVDNTCHSLVLLCGGVVPHSLSTVVPHRLLPPCWLLCNVAEPSLVLPRRRAAPSLLLPYCHAAPLPSLIPSPYAGRNYVGEFAITHNQKQFRAASLVPSLLRGFACALTLLL